MSRVRNKLGQFSNEGFNKNGLKKCVICKKIQKSSLYSKNKSEYDGRNKRCRSCSTIYMRKWRSKNVKRNLETGRRYYRRHKKERRENCKKWVRNNPVKHKSLLKINAAKRRASLINRTPTWANLEEIKKIYDNCPVGMVVDHIIPLQGKIVSGLHVHQNLQYLSQCDNLIKGNKYSYTQKGE